LIANMILTKEMKKWLKVFVPLFVLLAGFPLWTTSVFLLIMSSTGLTQLYGVGMWLDELYYSVPISMLGDGWYPYHEFGLDPGLKGIIAGAMVYTLIALIFSLLLCFGLPMPGRQRKR